MTSSSFITTPSHLFGPFSFDLHLLILLIPLIHINSVRSFCESESVQFVGLSTNDSSVKVISPNEYGHVICCSILGGQNIEWTKGDGMLPILPQPSETNNKYQFIDDKNRRVLYISNASVETDEDIYQCSEISKPSNSKKIQIQVKFLVNKVRTHKVAQLINDKEPPFKLHCPIKEDEEVRAWFIRTKGDKDAIVPQTDGSVSYEYAIIKNSIELYQPLSITSPIWCQYQRKRSSKGSSNGLSYYEIVWQIYTSAEISFSIPTGKAVQGKPFSITCEFRMPSQSQQSIQEVQWLLDGRSPVVHAFARDDSQIKKGKALLTHERYPFNDSKNVTCTIRTLHIVEPMTYSFSSQSVMVDVFPIPRITNNDLMRLETNELEEANIRCNVQGRFLQVSMRVTRDEGKTWRLIENRPPYRLNEFRMDKEGLHDLHLQIKGITREQAGEYECRAENEAGTVIERGYIYVNYNAVISGGPDKMYFYQQGGIVTCNITGYPLTIDCSSMTFELDNVAAPTKQILCEADKFSGLHTQFKVFPRVSGSIPRQEGYCKHKNADGKEKKYLISLLLAQPPKPPTISVKCAGPKSVTFNVNRPHLDPNAPEHEKILRYTFEYNTIKNFDLVSNHIMSAYAGDDEVRVDNLTADTTLTFRFNAENAYGIATSQLINVTTASLRKPKKPMGVSVTVDHFPSSTKSVLEVKIKTQPSCWVVFTDAVIELIYKGGARKPMPPCQVEGDKLTSVLQQGTMVCRYELRDLTEATIRVSLRNELGSSEFVETKYVVSQALHLSQGGNGNSLSSRLSLDAFKYGSFLWIVGFVLLPFL